ncbi:MAG: SpoIIE family protein phosphatase [Bacteroidetes bacterium]|nr:SpoIIE family protein phosphatase [Bacteroidota bacterium]
MTFRIAQHHWYRAAAILLFSGLLVLAVMTFYGFFSTPTDENIFQNAPTRFMAVRAFPASHISSKPFAGGASVAAPLPLDSVRNGDLIMTINNGSVKTMKDAYAAIDRSPGDEVRFEILRPSLNTLYTVTARREALPEQFIVRLPDYVYVIDVTAGGASDRGGMKKGDLILRINQQEFTNAFEADRVLRLGQIGRSLKYEILRDNRFMVMNIELAKYGVSISALMFTLSGLIWMVIGLSIVVMRPKLLAARLVGFGFLLIGFFIATLVVRRDFFLTPEVILRQLVIGLSYVLGTAFLFHATHYFPVERPDLIRRRWIAWGYYIAPLISAGLNSLDGTGLSFLLNIVYGIGVMIVFRKGATAEYRQYNTVMRWTAMLAFTAALTVMWFARNTFQTVGIGLLAIILLSIPLSYLYTVARHRLLDMSFRVRRNTQYTIVTVLWGTAVFYALLWAFFRLPQLDLPQANIVFTGTAIEVNDAPELASQRGTSERVMLMALAIALTFTVLRLRVYGQQLIDKKYFRQEYDYRRASVELGEVLSATLSAEALAKGLVQKLSELMKLKRVGVLFFREEECCSCLSVHGFDGSAWEKFCMAHERELIGSIKQFRNEFRIDYLPPAVKEEFHREGFHYGIPIRSKERLIGVLLVGEKQSESTFRQEDLAFLATTAKQSSVAIENAFLYEELAEKERMKHELQIARKIQLDSLPQRTPSVQGLQIAGTSVPAMEVGGDFFDYLSNGNGKVTVVIGDVSGKGTSAALYMSKVQGILRSLHGFDLPPKELFRRANTLLCQDLEKRSFVTVLGAEFDTAQRTVTVSRAGHLPLLQYHAKDGSITKVLPRGLGLGLNDASIFSAEMEERRISYETGDVFLFATDGVTEAHNTGGDFGEERLHEFLRNHHAQSAAEQQSLLIASLTAFTGDREQHDDQTVVFVKAVD